MANNSTTQTSKFLSLVLRHKPETIGMQLDPDGWLEVDALIRNANDHGKSLTLEMLHDVVATNDKQRFSLSDDGLLIRANQGHSVPDIDLNLTAVAPPEQLFHGTVDQFLKSIRARGLCKRSRNHVHLSSNNETARLVGARRGTPIILTIDANTMHEAGHKFFLSANNVWLTNSVPSEFIAYPVEHQL
ncbi:MAG: RNA 2'-phosphotransferase [Pirellulaceae bacterium]